MKHLNNTNLVLSSLLAQHLMQYVTDCDGLYVQTWGRREGGQEGGLAGERKLDTREREKEIETDTQTDRERQRYRGRKA